MKKKQPTKTKTIVATFSAEESLIVTAKDHARSIDSDFSKYLRGLVRKDLKQAGIEVAA